MARFRATKGGGVHSARTASSMAAFQASIVDSAEDVVTSPMEIEVRETHLRTAFWLSLIQRSPPLIVMMVDCHELVHEPTEPNALDAANARVEWRIIG